MKFLQTLLRIEPVLRTMGMKVTGDTNYVAVTAGESLITLTRTNGASYNVASLKPYHKEVHVATLVQPTSEDLLKAIHQAR